jgi:hypothetical protein
MPSINSTFTTDLEHTEIYRAGGSAAYLHRENSRCSFRMDPEKRALEFRFHLKAAGGGTTEVLLRVGINDFPFITRGIDQLQTLELARLRQRVIELEANKTV